MERVGSLLEIVARLHVYVGQFAVMIYALATLLGVLFVIVGLRAAALRSEQGSHGGGWGGPIAWIVVGLLLLAFPATVLTLSQSLFGTGGMKTEIAEVFTEAPDLLRVFETHASRETIEGLMRIVQLFGLIAIVRGLFLLNAHVQPNRPPSFGAGMTHLVGGVLAVNIVSVLIMLNEIVGPGTQ